MTAETDNGYPEEVFIRAHALDQLRNLADAHIQLMGMSPQERPVPLTMIDRIMVNINAGLKRDPGIDEVTRSAAVDLIESARVRGQEMKEAVWSSVKPKLSGK